MKRGTNIDRLHVAIQVSNLLVPPNCTDLSLKITVMKRVSNRWAHSLSFLYDLKSLRILYMKTSFWILTIPSFRVETQLGAKKSVIQRLELFLDPRL